MAKKDPVKERDLAHYEIAKRKIRSGNLDSAMDHAEMLLKRTKRQMGAAKAGATRMRKAFEKK